VLRGRLTADQMQIAADLADRYGTGALRTTSMQNFLIPDVRRERVQPLARELEAAGFALEASPFRRGTVACTGSEFCKLALTETKGFARGLVETLEQRLPGFDQQLRINVTGCPNSCGQHWIADLGIEGKKVKVDGAIVDAYYFCVGGAVGRHQAVARPIGLRLPATAVAPAVERLLRAFLAERRASENFREFAARHTDEELRALLAGELVEAVTRDVAADGPPHGVDG
jgi:sulfite reductase (ferredoxin)